MRGGFGTAARMGIAENSAASFVGLGRVANARTAGIRFFVDTPAGVAMAGFLLLLPSLVWNFRDVHVWPWDHAYYAEVSLKIAYAMREGPLAWFSALLAVPDSRAPLLPWLAQAAMPFADVVGRPEPALLLTNVAAGAITLWLVFSATRRMGGSRAIGLLAMLACASASDTIAFNQQFLVECVQAMSVAGLAWIALSTNRLSLPRLAAGMIFWTTLALLAKTTSVGYVAPFLSYACIVRAASIGSGRAAAPRDVLLLIGAVAVAGMGAVWYALHWSSVLSHVKEATSGDIALIYGSHGPLLAKAQFWLWAIEQGLAPFQWVAELLLGIIAVALAIGLLRLPWSRPLRVLPAAIECCLLFALCLAGTILAVMFACSLSIVEDMRFLAPLVPLVVLLLSWSLLIIRRRWFGTSLALLLAANWLVTHAMTQGMIPMPQFALGYLHPVANDDRSVERLARAVWEGCDRNNATRVNVIGAEYPDFNTISAAFYAEKMRRTAGYRCGYTSLGYAQSNVNDAVRRLSELDPEFIITLPRAELIDDVFNHLSGPVADWLASSPDFARVTPEGDTLVIYRRR
jgi:hypothetical protein